MSGLKKLQDEGNTGGKNQIMDSLLAYTGCKTIMKITAMVYPRELEDDIQRIILSNKKEFETKEEIGHCRENKIPAKNTRTE